MVITFGVKFQAQKLFLAALLLFFLVFTLFIGKNVKLTLLERKVICKSSAFFTVLPRLKIVLDSCECVDIAFKLKVYIMNRIFLHIFTYPSRKRHPRA